MNNDDTITIDLSDTKPVEFTWDESDMSTGFVAQEVGTAYNNTVTLGSGISITATGIATGSSYTISPQFSTISTPYDDMEERLSKLEKIIAQEEEVRRTHPAVKMAYDEYRLLYILAKKNPGDHLTEE
jgi:hypothetical protein